MQTEEHVAAFNYSQVRKGMVIVGEDGQLYSVIDRDLNTPGNWRAILNLKLKNLKTGAVTPRRFKPEDKVEVAYLDKRPMQYLYQDGDSYVFMDKETFDQTTLSKEWVGDQILYLKENDDAAVTFYEGKPLSLELPQTVELKVVETEPSLKGATAQALYKPATLETGLKITVPPFVGVGEVIQIDTPPASTSAGSSEKETETLVPSINYVELRRGMIILEDGQLYQVMDRDLKTPGNLPSKLHIKVRNLKTGLVQDRRIHPEDKVETAFLETRAMQYLYQDGDGYVFMDKENYDQITLAKDWVGDQMMYLKENEDAKVTFHEGKPLSLELPNTVDLKVTETEPALKGATAAAQYKPATLETGLKITVPGFINIGEVVQVDTPHRRVPEPGEIKTVLSRFDGISRNIGTPTPTSRTAAERLRRPRLRVAGPGLPTASRNASYAYR